MRLIDSDMLLNTIYKNPASDPNLRCAQLLEAILEAPAVDPVVHAMWIAEYRVTCSACETQFDDDIYWVQGDFIAPQYCPHCGAKMDGEPDDRP